MSSNARNKTSNASAIASLLWRFVSKHPKTSANHRSAEFRRRCRVIGIAGVSLHSYRHTWAQRAKACGYPQRFAQEALGHSSRAIHEAYAKGVRVVCPALDQYEQMPPHKITGLRATA